MTDTAPAHVSIVTRKTLHRGEASFTFARAIRRAQWRARVTGVKHRVEICRLADDEHVFPDAWTGAHFVVSAATPVRGTTS